MVRRDARQPGDQTGMRPGTTQLGHDVRVEQVHHWSLGGERRRHRWRSRISISNRGSGARRSSLSVGRARCCSLRHSSIGTKTAVSTPRFVTICGPSVTLFSSSSLKEPQAFGHDIGPRLTIRLSGCYSARALHGCARISADHAHKALAPFSSHSGTGHTSGTDRSNPAPSAGESVSPVPSMALSHEPPC